MKKTRLDCLPIEDRRNGEDTEQGITVSVTEHVSLRSLSRGGGGQRGLEHPTQPPDQFFILQPRAVQ